MIRIGVIGAGGNTRSKHIPLLQKINSVEIVAVCNRSLESARKVCAEFGIPEAVADPHELIARKDIDAIVIGTWPYKHAEYSIAALAHGKHVLTEARMAMNAEEATQMLEASRRRPDLIAQVVPAPFTLHADPVIRELVENEAGKIVAVHAFDVSGVFPDPNAPYGWRQDRALSGNNIMAVGIRYESIMRWVGTVRELHAVTDVVVAERIEPASGRKTRTDIPDQLHVLGRLRRDDAAFLFIASSVAGGQPRSGCWIYGTTATVFAGFDGAVSIAKPGDAQTRTIDVAARRIPGWRVEEEFIGAIQGKEKIKYTTFEDGVKYMHFMDAIYRSTATKKIVTVRE